MRTALISVLFSALYCVVLSQPPSSNQQSTSPLGLVQLTARAFGLIQTSHALRTDLCGYGAAHVLWPSDHHNIRLRACGNLRMTQMEIACLGSVCRDTGCGVYHGTQTAPERFLSAILWLITIGSILPRLAEWWQRTASLSHNTSGIRALESKIKHARLYNV